MKRKISILTLTILFFASTTGLPLTLHFCEMEMSDVVEECKMHEVKKQVSCCEESIDYPVKFSKENNCCEIKQINSSVRDNYVSAKNDLVVEISKIITENCDVVDISKQYYFSPIELSSLSPPQTSKVPLFLKLSFLLI